MRALPTLLFFLLLLGRAQCEEILRVEGYPRPGGVLFVTLEGLQGPWDGKALFGGKTYAFTEGPGGFELLLPISPEARDKAILLEVPLPSGRALERSVGIKPYRFAIQRLWLPASTEALYEHPYVEEEYRKIDKALLTFTPERQWKENFARPCSGGVRTDFGIRRITNGKPAGYHRGVDIAGAYGEPVYASNKGIVRLVSHTFQLHGKTVILDHGQGVMTLYIHLSSVQVREGDVVEKGDPIARVGSSGVSTGPHLHWGAYVQGEPIDPRLLFAVPRSWR